MRWKIVLRIVFAAAAALALGYTPWKSAGVLRQGLSCEVSAPLSVWWIGMGNARHILSYGVLCWIGIASFRKHRVAWGAGATLAISALVEIEQAVFADGHCRVRDLGPNLLAVGIAVVVWVGWRRARGGEGE